MSGSTSMEHILRGTMSDARLWRHGSQLSLPITFDVALTDWMKEDGITPLAYITKLSIRLANATLIARCGYSTAWHVWGRCSRFATLPPPLAPGLLPPSLPRRPRFTFTRLGLLRLFSEADCITILSTDTKQNHIRIFILILFRFDYLWWNFRLKF